MILVTGATGFVGQKLLQMCKDTIACPSLKNATEDEIRRIIEKNDIHTIIHTAAISDIGTCQNNPEASYIANVRLPLYLAKASAGKKLICFSSDQVYSAAKEEGPYTEDMVKPGNIYAQHKLEMEQRVLDIDPNAVMLRAEWMYDYYLKKSNYFMNIINATDKLSFSSQQFRGLTYVKEVAENMEKVIALPGGAYNFGSETKKSMYDITKDFLALTKKNITLCDAPPRHNLWMDCEKARKYGVEFSTVEDGLARCAKDYGVIKKADI